jgi:hypothetical protein
VLVPEWHAGKPQEREHLEAVTVVVGNAEQFAIGVKASASILRETRTPWLIRATC